MHFYSIEKQLNMENMRSKKMTLISNNIIKQMYFSFSIIESILILELLLKNMKTFLTIVFSLFGNITKLNIFRTIPYGIN